MKTAFAFSLPGAQLAETRPAARGPSPVRRYRPLPRWLRVVATVMLPVYFVTSIPAYLQAQTVQAMHEAADAVIASFTPAPPEIKVNRTLPPGVVDDNAPAPHASATISALHFSSVAPKDSEFFQARIFAEPLVPTDGKAVPAENEALAKALLAYAQAPVKADPDVADRLAPINQFLVVHPASRWGLSLWLNLGSLYRHAGYWTRALDAWEQAWTAGKQAMSPNARALADLAVAELAELNARLGRYERLQPLLAELDGAHRALGGAAATKLSGARQGLWLMNNQPELAFRCGPMALNCLRLAENPKVAMEPKIFDAHSTRQGISLTQVAALSRDIGRPMQMAFRTADEQGKGAEFITPSVVHWKAGHYAALVEQKGSRYRVDDPTFGDTTWVSQAALEAETDGYYLVAEKTALPAGWRTVPEAEGDKVWGKGNTNSKNPNATKATDPRCKTCPPTYGMATYNIEAMLTSLAIGDTPLSYTPPRGGPISFGMQYSQAEASQSQVFTYWNMGNKWTNQWTSFIEDNGTAAWLFLCYDQVTPVYYQSGGVLDGPPPILHLPGGGTENYQTYTQINSFFPSTAPSDAPAVIPIFYSYAAQDQPVEYQTETVPWPSGYNVVPGSTYTYSILVRPRLVQKGVESYERDLPDGTVEIYNHSDGATTYPRRIFLTKRADPSGNTTTFSYDNQSRLLSVTDALGQVTTLSYNLASDPLKVTSVTDPFGRSCQLAYQADGHLQSITDTAGIQSRFTYLPNSDSTSSDFINSLVTPYGKSSFAFADVTTDPTMGVAAWLEAIDPYGDTERAEFRHGAPGIPFSESAVPAGIPVFNEYISSRNTYYWDKKAYQEAKQSDGTFDYTRARIMHFMHDVDTNVTSGVLESTKQPLENRVWMFYQGENSPGFLTNGQSTNPSLVARVLDDGSTQLSQYQYNDQQRVTQATDPLGRVTAYDYDPANNLDLLGARNTTGGLNEQLFAATYNAAHQPLTTTDAAGQTTTLAYLPNGQLQTSQDPLGRTITFQYNNGYLQEIDGFDPSIKSTFTYDGFGRLASTTAYPDAYTIQVGYDAVGGNPLATLNRPTTATYPDGSYTQVGYTNLDVEWMRDRAGNWRHLLTNHLRQTVASIDPLGNVTQYGYCKCGQLVSLVDPNGNNTRWKLDAQERPIAKVYADGTEVDSVYEQTTSRLHQVTDAKGQTSTFQYNVDGTLASVAYAGSAQATPGVSYGYDPQRGRLATRTDGIGTTTYSYYPFGSGGPGGLGAGKVQSVSGPFANESVAYQYDPLGRVTTRTVDGVDETYGYEPLLGRLQTDTNALGTFTYGYDGTTSRVSSVGYPNGQQALYSYAEDNTQDRRLAQIKHVAPGGGLLDEFDYGYDGPLGRIAHWGQQQPGAAAGTTAANTYDLGYDAAGQLTQAVLNGDAANPGSGVWSYDAAGNRTGIQAGSSTVSTAVPTPTNALFSLGGSGGGRVQVAGSLSKWASVSVNGQAASVNAATNTFQASVPLALGTQTLSVSATDASANVASNQYQLTISAGAGASFGYDANGNTTGLAPVGGTAQSLEVDACDRVTAINTGAHRSEFVYDGGEARVRITEKDSGQVTKDRLFVANEERDAASGQVLRRFYAQGEQRLGGNSAGSYFYAGDHLGSVRELTDNTGTPRASYGYDQWGTRTKLQGDLDTEPGFTGYWHHPPSGLELSPTRLYSASLGRFLSQDPLQEGGGQLNLYAYCANDPTNHTDLLGLSWGGIALGLGVGIVGAIGIGLLAPELAASLLGASLIGAALGLAGDLAGQLYDNGGNWGCIDWTKAAVATALGALFGAAGLYANPYIGDALESAAGYVGNLFADATEAIANPVSETLARVIPNGIEANTLGAPGAARVFVTNASELEGLNAQQIAEKLAIPESPTGFQVITFATPEEGLATPIVSESPGFVGGGQTAGGASEFTIPNGPIPAGATITVVH